MSVAETRERVAASIVRARALEQALADLEHLPEVDARAVAFAAHALGNYLAVTGGTADLLLGSLADHPDRQVRLWLEGISQEDQAKLFRRGVRLSSVPTGNEESTGYGLAVAKDLVDAMGGTIWCESRLGHGARFSSRLPKDREED